MSWKIDRLDDVAVVTMHTDSSEEKEWAFFRDLGELCDRLDDEFPTCAVVLTGGQGGFSGGLDYERTLDLFARRDVDELRGWFARFRTTILRLFTLPRPTIAALGGDTLAADLVLACACDFRISVAEGTRIGLNGVRHGVPLPSVGVELMKYAVGSRAAASSALSGQLYDPPAALALGLVHRLAPAAELLEQTLDWARNLPARSRAAYAQTKHLLQAETLERMEHLSAPLDSSLLATFFSDANLEAQAGARERVEPIPKTWRR
jgi:enoyl-CoA hydratase